MYFFKYKYTINAVLVKLVNTKNRKITPGLYTGDKPWSIFKDFSYSS